MPIPSSPERTPESSRDHSSPLPGHLDRGHVHQDATGPSGPFLEGGPAQHMAPPQPGRREDIAHDEAAEAHLAARVREALRDHGDIDASKVEVIVDGDHVILRGSVRSHWAHHYASNLTSAVDGVGSLDNELEIERTDDGRDVGGPTADTGAGAEPKKHYP